MGNDQSLNPINSIVESATLSFWLTSVFWKNLKISEKLSQFTLGTKLDKERKILILIQKICQ